MEADIFQGLEEVFSKVFNREVELNLAITAKDIQGWDSLRHVLLITEIEKKFNIKFSFKEVSSFNCVEDIVKIINAKLSC